YHCQDERCTRGARASTGEPCTGNGDCAGNGSFCADQGGRRWCTRFCTEAMACPEGLACVAAGGASVCAPSGALLGETCARDGEGRARCLARAPSGGGRAAPGGRASTGFASLLAPLALLLLRRRRSPA